MESRRSSATTKDGVVIEFTLDWHDGLWTMDAIDEDMDSWDNGFICRVPDEDIAIERAKKYINTKEF